MTAAAAVLSYTASAVSQHVTALEREVGTPLLERVGRGVAPTPAGRLLAEHATEVLARIAEAEEALEALRTGKSGRLRIASFPTAGASLVPPAVAAFRAARPAVELDLRVAEPDESIPGLLCNQVDVAVAVQPFAPGDGGDEALHYRHLLDDEYRIVVARGHRFGTRRSLDLAQLADEPFVATASCPGYCLQSATDACLEAGFSPRYEVEADEYPATQGYVAAGLGVALIPLLGLGALHDGVRVLRIRGARPVRHVYAVTRPSDLSEGAIPAFLEALEQAVGAERNRRR